MSGAPRREGINAGAIEIADHVLDQARVDALADFRLQDASGLFLGNHHPVHQHPLNIESVATDHGPIG